MLYTSGRMEEYFSYIRFRRENARTTKASETLLMGNYENKE